MKEIALRSSRNFYLVFITPILLTLGGLALNYSASHKNQNLSEIKYGVNLCFTRLTQSLIALQGQDYFSKHLERSYIDFTNECFFEFKEKVVGSFSQVEVAKLVDQLVEDAQNFSKAILTQVSKRQSDRGDKISTSAILPAYSKVDFSRFNLNQWIKDQETNSSWFNWQNFFFVCMLLFINAIACYLIWNLRSQQLAIAKLEDRATSMGNEFDQQPHRLEIFLGQVFEHFQMNKTQDVFKKFVNLLMDQSVTLAKMRETNASAISGEVATNSNASVAPAAFMIEATVEDERTIDDSAKDWVENIAAAMTVPAQPAANNTPPAFKAETFSTMDSVSTTDWTDDDETANVLPNDQEFTPVTEPLTDLAELINVSAKALSNNGSHMVITHQATNAPFWLKGDHEHYEQLFIALLNKIENRFNEFDTKDSNRSIAIDFRCDTVSNQVDIYMQAAGALFHIDDLEYFHDQDHLTVDSNNVIIKEMVKELYGEIKFKNLIGENLEDNSLQITIKVPLRERAIEQQTAKIVQLVKGKKKELIANTKNRAKEIII